MSAPLTDLRPFIVALDVIELAKGIRFDGFDLDTGRRVSVVIERSAPEQTQTITAYAAEGLVLMLTVQPIIDRV